MPASEGRRSGRGAPPIPQGLVAYVLSVVIRVGVGAALAATAASGKQVAGAFGAFGLGVAAPLVIEKLARAVPVSVIEPELEDVSATPEETNVG